MVESLVDTLGGAINPWGYVLLFLLCVLEASAFVGLLVPGETALLIAGVLSQQGRLSIVACIVCATIGAVAGDSLGYEIGRHFGPRMRSSRLGRRVGDERWDRGHDYVRRNGGKAVFLGRFVGLLRALVPAVAGDARMPYRQFLTWNVLGALVVAPGVIVLGYFAGSSYHLVEQRLGQATYALVAVVLVVVAVRHFVKHRSGAPVRAG